MTSFSIHRLSSHRAQPLQMFNGSLALNTYLPLIWMNSVRISMGLSDISYVILFANINIQSEALIDHHQSGCRSK